VATICPAADQVLTGVVGVVGVVGVAGVVEFELELDPPPQPNVTKADRTRAARTARKADEGM
jgi:hypothetical protein